MYRRRRWFVVDGEFVPYKAGVCHMRRVYVSKGECDILKTIVCHGREFVL